MKDLEFLNNSELCSFYKIEMRIFRSFPSQAFYVNYAVGCALNVLLTISTILLNSVLIIAYWRSPRLRQKNSYFLIMLLSINDFVVGIFGNANLTVNLALTLYGNSKCITYILVDLLAFPTAAMSFMTLFALNVERYLSIVHPIYHRTNVTKSKLLRSAVLLWLISLAVTFCYPTLGAIAKNVTTFIMCFIIFATCYVYFAIFRTARKPARSASRSQREQDSQNINLAKSCVVVVICTLVCYLPFAVTRSFQRHDYQTLVFAMWSITFALSAPSLNCVVFFLRNPVFRTEVEKIFRKNNSVVELRLAKRRGNLN